MTFDDVMREPSERGILIEMVEDLIYLIESADKLEDIYTDRYKEIKAKLPNI